MNPPRKSHRKRISALRLSSDTTALPEYYSSPWSRRSDNDPIPSDKPPDYPDSAEEADEDTDTDNNVNIVYVPQFLPSPTASPQAQTASRRAKRFQTHKRKLSSISQPTSQPTDSFLDSLLERSVDALEMSNTLLQSSISTQATVSAFLASDSPGDTALEARAIGLSSQLLRNWDVQDSWADELDEIRKDVEGLLSPNGTYHLSNHSSHSRASTTSRSLPSISPLSHSRSHRRRPSMDYLHQTHASEPHLSFAQQNRSNLISPPPRALTMYIASTEDPDSITLPSTLGIRPPPLYHHSSDWRPLTDISSSTTNLLSNTSLPRLIDKPDLSTPAYNMLSSLVARTTPSGSSTPSTSLVSSFRSRRRNSSSTARSHSSSSAKKSPERPRLDYMGSSTTCPPTQTPLRGISPMRPMTPPIEESSSSSDDCVAKRTVVSLRKILDDQPLPQPSVGLHKDESSSRSSSVHRRRAPAFMPLTPAPVADSGTSTATASISRLFTKGIHSSSTRPRSPPRSVMKQSSPANTNTSPSPRMLHMPDLLGVGMVAKAFGGSTSSSGYSTPKRISFAVLPESYSSTRPEGLSSGFRDKGKGKRRKGGALAAKSSPPDGSDIGGWWNNWLVGGLGTSLARQDEQTEDRITRNWAGRMGAGLGGGLDEWAA